MQPDARSPHRQESRPAAGPPPPSPESPRVSHEAHPGPGRLPAGPIRPLGLCRQLSDLHAPAAGPKGLLHWSGVPRPSSPNTRGAPGVAGALCYEGTLRMVGPRGSAPEFCSKPGHGSESCFSGRHGGCVRHDRKGRHLGATDRGRRKRCWRGTRPRGGGESGACGSWKNRRGRPTNDAPYWSRNIGTAGHPRRHTRHLQVPAREGTRRGPHERGSGGRCPLDTRGDVAGRPRRPCHSPRPGRGILGPRREQPFHGRRGASSNPGPLRWCCCGVPTGAWSSQSLRASPPSRTCSIVRPHGWITRDLLRLAGLRHMGGACATVSILWATSAACIVSFAPTATPAEDGIAARESLPVGDLLGGRR